MSGMAYTLNLDPRRKKRRIRPLKAWHHMKILLADKEDTEQVFHIFEALDGGMIEKTLHKFAATEKGAQVMRERRYLPDILDNHEELLKLPQGTVGRAYVDFMRREGLTAAGLVAESEKWWDQQERFDDDLEFFSNRLRDTRDMFHVLSGYGRDKLGETSLLAFSHSQNGSRGNLFIAFIGSRDLAKTSPKNAPIMAAYREGRRNGKLAAKIAAQDIIAMLPRPLDEVREELGIREPVKYKEAIEALKVTGYEAELSAA